MLTGQKFVLSRLPKPILKKKRKEGLGVYRVADVLEDEDSVVCSFSRVNRWKASYLLQELTLQLTLATLDWPPVRFSVGQSGFETSFLAPGTALSHSLLILRFLLFYLFLTNE